MKFNINELSAKAIEHVGNAAGHTIGLVIPNVEAAVSEMLGIPRKYSSLGIISARIGACTQIAAVDEAVKGTNTDLVLFELSRDTEGYGGPGSLLIVGSSDVSDARRAVQIALRDVARRAHHLYVNEVGHMEIQTSANAGPVLNQIFGCPLKAAFGFMAVGPAGVGIVTADACLKAAPVRVIWHGTPNYNTPHHNDVITVVTGRYESVLKATETAYIKGSQLITTYTGTVPQDIYTFFGLPDEG